MVGKQQVSQRIPLEPWEVGGELLDILSRGLYTDAKDALREYVQNSVDADANNVHITIDGPVVTVRDDGHGMDFDTLRRARRLGASDKGRQFNVGFRGIGIYAAFGMCETLTIHTHQADTSELLGLTMRFGEMSRVLERDRNAPQRSSIALTDLLFEHTDFLRANFTGNLNDQFTMVRLEGIQPEYRSQLSNLSEVHGYLLNTLPVLFPDTGYGLDVNHWMRDTLDLNPVRVVLRVGKDPEVVVAPQVAVDVHEPQTTYLKDAEGRELAFMWYALSATRDHVSAGRAVVGDSDIGGFLLKIKGFTLGNRTNVKHLWPLVGARALYHHYTGEIHVLGEAGAIPNAARSDLEVGRPRDVLYRHLQDKFTVLNSDADVARTILKIRDDLSGAEEEARRLFARMDSPDESPFELYRLSRNFIEDMERSEGDLKRLKGRGRSRRAKTVFPPSVAQDEEITELLTWVNEPKEIANRVVRATNRRTSSTNKGRPAEPKQPALPQVALLREALDGLMGMGDKLPPDAFAATQVALEAALRLQVVPNAIAALDDLKATGFTLSETVESSRRQLRSHLGWAPSAPVSLFEALAQDGFLPATQRERALIQAIDNGLRRGLGGRGEAYENLLRAVAEAIKNHPGLG